MMIALDAGLSPRCTSQRDFVLADFYEQKQKNKNKANIIQLSR